MKKFTILGLGLVWCFVCLSQVEATGTIRGAITSGVQVTLSGNASKVTTTSDAGTYAFTGLPDGDYKVTPAKLYCSFSPGSRTITINNADVDNVNFAVTYGPPTIRVTWPTEGVTITSEGSITTTLEVENFNIGMAPEGYYDGYIILVLYVQCPGDNKPQPVWTGFINQTSYTFKQCVPGTYTVSVGLADMFHTRQHNPESVDEVIFRFELAPGVMNPVKNLSGESNDNTIRVKWENPYNAYYTGTVVFRGTQTFTEILTNGASYPVGALVDNGKVVYNDDGELFTDEDSELKPLTTYHYTAFAYDKDGTYSVGLEDTVTLNDIPPGRVAGTEVGREWYDQLDSLYWTKITGWQPIQPTSFSIILNWAAPGADGYQGQASTYTIKWTTQGTDTLINNFTVCETPPGMLPKPSFADVRDHMVVIGTGTDDRKLPFEQRKVQPETTYFFALKTADRGGQVSALSNVFQKTTLDETSPGTVTNLAIANVNVQEGSLMLVWKSPGDDGNITWSKDKGFPSRTDDKYDIRYSTVPITEDTWVFSAQVGTPTPKKMGAAEVFVVENLQLDKYEYYFALKTVDEQYNVSPLSNIVSTDMLAPGTITDLKAGSVTASTVQLTWTNSGDNGTQGVANSYDVRYDYVNITDANWDDCFSAFGEPKPGAPGTKATFTVAGLSWGKTYYFALKAIDEAGNKSSLSNVAQVTTLGQEALPTPPIWKEDKCLPGDTVLYLSWDKSPQSDIGGYLLSYDEKSYEGSVTKAYANLIDVGNVTEYELGGLENDKKYYLALRAYNTNSYPSDYSEEITRTPVSLGYQYEPLSVIIPMGNQQTGDEGTKLDKIRNAYKACFEHVYKNGNMEWTASTSHPYHGSVYNAGTFISEYSPATGTVINLVSTPVPDYVTTEPGVGTGNVLGLSKSYSLQPIKIALFYSDLMDEYEQYITWEEGYFEQIFRMYLWGEYFDRVNEQDIREGKLANYDLVIFPSVKKGYVQDVVATLTTSGLANLKSFVANGGILYTQGECVYLVEKLGLVGSETVHLEKRVTDGDNKGLLTILDESHPLTFSWSANETYVLDDPFLLEKPAVANATQTIIAKYADTNYPDSPAIIYVEHQLGAAVMMPSHPSDKTEYFPLVLDAVLLTMSRRAALTSEAIQRFCEDVPKDVIPGLEADVPVYVTITFCNFWNNPLKDVEVKSVVQPGFNIVESKSEVSPLPSNIQYEGTTTNLGQGTLTTITWSLGQVDKNTKLVFSFWVFTEANAIKKGEAVVCKTEANYIETPGGEVTVYARDPKLYAKMAARLVGDRALDKLTAYGVVGSGIFSDVVFPVENKEDTLAKNVQTHDLAALVAPIVDVMDNRKIVWSVGGTYWDVGDGDANAWVRHEIFFFDDPRYPLPIEAENRYVKFNVNNWDGITTYIYENPYAAPIEIPEVYKAAQWGPNNNMPLISLAPNGDMVLPAQKLTWTGTWTYHQMGGYDFIDPLIRYGVRSEELPPPYPGISTDKNKILPPRTILMATLPNIPERYVVNGKVLMDAKALFFLILLGSDENPYKQYLSQGIAYAPIPTNIENLPRVKWQDMWGRQHSAPLRTMDPQFKKSNDFFPTVQVYPTVNDTYELYAEGDGAAAGDGIPYTREDNERLYLEYDVKKPAKLHLIVKTCNSSREFEQIYKPSEAFKINKDQSLIVKDIFKGLGFDTQYERHWLTDYQNIGYPTQLVDEKDDQMFHTLYFNQALNTGEKEEIHVWADMKTYHPEVHYEGPMKVNDGSRYIFHKPKEGPNQYMIMDAHTQAVWGLSSDVEISKKVAPINIGNYGDTVFHIIKVEDPYEPREFDLDTYLKSYGFGRITASTFVGGRIDDKLCTPRLAPGDTSFVRIEVCNNLGGSVDEPYTLRNVTITPDMSDPETSRITSDWMEIINDELLNTTPPVHQDLSYLLVSQDEPKIPDGWRGIVYFRINTDTNIPVGDRGKVHKLKFKLTADEPGSKLTETKFEIPAAWIGIEDAQGHVLTSYGSSTIVTFTDGFPSFVEVQEAKLATATQKAEFERLIGLDVNNKPRGTQAAIYFDGLTTPVGFDPNKGTVAFTLPANALQLPWYEGDTPRQDFYVMVKSITESTRSGIKVVNEGPKMEFNDHFNHTGTAAGNLETVVVHGAAMHQEYIVNQIRRAFNGEITETLTLNENNEVEIKLFFLNTGDDIAETPVITMNLANGVTLLSAEPGTFTQQGNLVKWEYGQGGNIAPGSEKNIYLTLSLIPTSPSPSPPQGNGKGPKPAPGTDYFDLIGSTSITYKDAFLGMQISPPPLGSLTLPAMAPSVTAPTNLQATGHPGSISLRWDFSMGTSTTFNIYRTDVAGTGSFPQINNGIGTITYIDKTVTEDIRYYYVVTAVVSGEGEGPASNVGSATPGDIWAPGTITDLAAIVITSGSVTLQWTAPGDNDFKGTASAYIIKYAPVGGEPSLFTTPPIPKSVGSVQQATITELFNNTAYQFYIRTQDEANNLSGTATVNATTLPGATITCSVHLRAGWNLISLPLRPGVGSYTAEKLVQNINASGGTADIAQRWTDGSTWESYQVGIPVIGNEFYKNMPIEIGRGYFVHCKNPSDWQMTGNKIESQIINLRLSWNLIGLGVATTTARSLLQDINAQNGSVSVIQRWTAGSQWVGHQLDLPFNDFTTAKDQGYFIYSKNISEYSPNWLRESNFISTSTDKQVTISWITTSNLQGKVLYGTTNTFGNSAFDVRGAGISDDTHLVTITGLAANTTYYYALVCGNSTDPGTYIFTTASQKLPQSESTISGFVKKGGSAVAGAIVYVKLKDDNGAESPGESTWAACLTDASGKWEIDLKKLRTTNLGGFFTYSGTDKVYIEVEAASSGKASTTVNANVDTVDDINLP
ncbi:MAG: fibronectin type III domain-containing protein [Nitrospirota bacterium]